MADRPDEGATYLGDGVYAEFDGFQVWIWVSNGITRSAPIAIVPGVLDSLNRFYGRMTAQQLGGPDEINQDGKPS